MAETKGGKKTFKVFRYDPAKGGEGHFDTFVLEIEDYYATTILDVLFRIQREHDQSLSFRYACRVAMCGSCGMVINGKEGLACKTVVANLKTPEITLRPLNHFPIVKDLTVDMEPFFKKYEEAMPYFDPAQEASEPAIVRPDTWERKAIDMATDCIACGCCVSSCTMAFWHKDYLGPAALNRSMTLLADSRDGLHDERLATAMESCYNCRLEFNCTEVCPKEISPTRAIKYIHRMAMRQGPGLAQRLSPAPEPIALPAPEPLTPAMSRRSFLGRTAVGLGAVAGATLAGLVLVSAISAAFKDPERKWVPLGPLEKIAAEPGEVLTIYADYSLEDGFYKRREHKPVLVEMDREKNKVTAFNSRCTHLGCTVHWDQQKKLFICACHGGTFFPDGTVKSGPPPRPLDRYETKVSGGQLYVLEA